MSNESKFYLGIMAMFAVIISVVSITSAYEKTHTSHQCVEQTK